MLITIKTDPIDLARRGPTPVVDAVQDDKSSRQLQIELLENGSAWSPPSGLTPLASYRKPDGKGGMYDTLPDGSSAFSVSGNVVTVILAPQVCTVAGVVKFTVGFLQGEKSLYAFGVDLVVQPNPGVLAASEDFYKLSGVLAASGWSPNMYLATDGNGNVIAKAGGGGGGTGEDGATFTPSISDDGVLSWTNDKGLGNPEPVDMVSKVVSALPNGGVGEDGATFIPSISDDGVLSWTNDKGLNNPASVDLVTKVVAALPVYKMEVEDA